MAAETSHTMAEWAAQDEAPPWRLALALVIAQQRGMNPGDAIDEEQWRDLLAEAEAHHVVTAKKQGE